MIGKFGLFATWLSKRRFDPVLFVAALVEIPRWTFAFLAIHEPVWAGIALGALLSWAAKRGWDAFFASGSKWMLSLNLFSLATAVAVISPVLYAMTYGPVSQVHLPETLAALGPSALGIWAILLALTTFIPLVQVACATYYLRPAMGEFDASELEQAFDEAMQALERMPQSTQAAPAVESAPANNIVFTERHLSEAEPVATNGNHMRLMWKSYRAAGKSLTQADAAVAYDLTVDPRTVANKRRKEQWDKD